ncbi:MAG: response regulator, partial [Paludibacteraceae bacterium]|nr:response regulator [Paludibacteraceae bacterium]
MRQILWVDDEIDLLQPYIIYLKDKGYEVITASNGEDALDIVNGMFDIVFLDENMPGMTGLETLQQDLVDVFENIVPTCRREGIYLHPGPKALAFAATE